MLPMQRLAIAFQDSADEPNQRRPLQPSLPYLLE
jgi:hypothetical protein